MSISDPPPLPEEIQDWPYIPSELFRKPWEHFAPFLRSHGYILAYTPEYDMDPVVETTPTKPAKDPFCPADDEDFIYRLFGSEQGRRNMNFFQATATSYLGLDRHRRNVYFKAVLRSSSEWQIIKFLSSPPLRADPKNHTIPHVKIITAGEWVFIIQAYWSPYWSQSHFDSVKARVNFAKQMIEGLAFMHENGVGHGDIHPDNIVWNHDNRRGLHLRVAPGQEAVPFQSTFDCRFAFIDFGCSTQFPPGVQDHTVTTESRPPSQYAAPEQFDDQPYDVFASDVFNLGRVLARELEDAIEMGNLEAITTAKVAPDYLNLLEWMTLPTPLDRPTAKQTLQRLNSILKSRLK